MFLLLKVRSSLFFIIKKREDFFAGFDFPAALCSSMLQFFLLTQQKFAVNYALNKLGISKSVMRSKSGRLLRNPIRRRSEPAFSKRRAEPKTEWVFLFYSLIH